MTEGPASSFCYLERNTHVFSQDPTVCRYNFPPTGTRAGSREENACQRSTHERPQSHMRGLDGLCQSGFTCVKRYWRCAP
jgi:hypothetical protein